MWVLLDNRTGELVENLREDFLKMIESTIPGTPMAVSDVYDVAALERAATSQILTHVRAASSSVTDLFVGTLRWNSQYDAMPVFVSDGPVIESWPDTHRPYTLGTERFVAASALLQAAISVKPASPDGAPIVDVVITNGRREFRRFRAPFSRGGNGEDGANSLADGHLFRTLLLDGFVHKNLALTATDEKGGQAFGFPLRCWHSGQRSITFCGDHVNDCASSGDVLAHGAFAERIAWVPFLSADIAGMTWDGGPKAQAAQLLLTSSRPNIKQSSLGSEEGSRFAQSPHLEYTDEMGTAVYSLGDRVYVDSIERVKNPWRTFGPIKGPSHLFNYTARYQEWFEASVAVPEAAYPGTGVGNTTVATIFRSEVTFKRANTIERMDLAYAGNDKPTATRLTVAIAANASATPVQIDVYTPDLRQGFVVTAGGWWALWDSAEGQPANAQLFTSRGDTVFVEISSCNATLCPTDWFSILAAGSTASNHITTQHSTTAASLHKPKPPIFNVTTGDMLVLELVQIGLTFFEEVHTLQEMLRVKRRIDRPESAAGGGLQLLRGTRLTGAAHAGLLEVGFSLDSGETAIELKIWPPRPAASTAMLPLRVHGAHEGWTVGLLQMQGFVLNTSLYGGAAVTDGGHRWSALGLSLAGACHVPLCHGLSLQTHVIVGHPVIPADVNQRMVKALRIQVTKVEERGRAGAVRDVWHVALNNPTTVSITTKLRQGMPIAELFVPSEAVTIAAGGWLVLPQAESASADADADELRDLGESTKAKAKALAES